MDRRKFCKTGLYGLGSLGVASILNRTSHAYMTDRQPNILFIMTDDHAQWAMGAYGNTEIFTPNMDRLAAQGMRFTQAITCPVCSASRAMVMTGCYNHQVGINDYIGRDESLGLPEHIPTLAEELKNAGYRTGLVGKWHLGSTHPEYYPYNHGFDYFVGMLGGGWEASMMDPVLLQYGRTIQFKGGLTDVLADHAVQFMQIRSQQPFALFFHTRRPHPPYVPVPDDDWEPYHGKTVSIPPEAEGKPYEANARKRMRDYYASVTSVDRNLGRLMDTLDEQGIADNTIVIFMGDNGYNIGHHDGIVGKGTSIYLTNNAPHFNMYETSVLVPLMIRYPAVIKPQSISNALINSIDIYPTLLDMAGIPRRPGVLLEGLSMLPLFSDENCVWRDAHYLAYDPYHYGIAHMRMIRTHEWKLVHHYEKGGEHKLYHLKEDPDEKKNLYYAGTADAIRNDLERKLLLWERRKGTE